MVKITMYVCSLTLMVLMIQNPILAFNPLAILQSKMDSLYALRDRLSSSASGRQDSGSPLRVTQEQDSGSPLRVTQEQDQDMSEASQTTYPNPLPTPSAKNSVLGSLFELGVSDIEREVPVKKQKPQISDFLNEIKNLPFLPLTDSNGSLPLEHKTPVLQYLDSLRGGAWAQFKSLALGYSNWLEDEYEIQDISGKLPLPLIRKILDLGDRVNFLHVVGKRVDLGLAKHLADKIQPLFDHFENLNPGRAFGSNISSAIGNIIQDTAWKTMHQFVDHILNVAERFVSKKDIEDFQIELSKTSPMVAKGLDFVINGLPSGSPGAAEGRSMISRKGYYDYDDGYSHDNGGYGGYGAYDESYGYGMQSQGYNYGVYLDPYLILGGLGAAALLAFLAYRIIVTTGGRRRRSDDLTFMELSDMPNIVYSFYNLLEGADKKYDPNEETTQLDDTDDLVNVLNSLWYEHEQEVSCLRCTLFDYVKGHFSMGRNVADTIAVAGVAHVLGAEKAGQLLDEVGSAMADGRRDLECLTQNTTCHVK